MDFELGYLRYGAPPESGKSYNYRDKFFEEGVSAYVAKFYCDGTYEVVPLNEQQWFNVINGWHRDVYRVWGDMIGVGSDGEPLLEVTRYEKIAECHDYIFYVCGYTVYDKDGQPLSPFIITSAVADLPEITQVFQDEVAKYKSGTITESRVYESFQIISSKPYPELSEEELAEVVSKGWGIDYEEVVKYE